MRSRIRNKFSAILEVAKVSILCYSEDKSRKTQIDQQTNQLPDGHTGIEMGVQMDRYKWTERQEDIEIE